MNEHGKSDSPTVHVKSPNKAGQPAAEETEESWLWHRALSRRSQNGRMLWDRMRRLIDRWLLPPRIYHPYPLRRLGVIT